MATSPKFLRSSLGSNLSPERQESSSQAPCHSVGQVSISLPPPAFERSQSSKRISMSTSVSMSGEMHTAALESKLAEALEKVGLLQATVANLHAQLADEQSKLADERTKVAALRTGLEESKKTIHLLQERQQKQDERRQSEALHAQQQQQQQQQGSRHTSLILNNVSEARRGSLSYLNGLGLATKRTAYFDPAKAPLGRASYDAAIVEDANKLIRRASMPVQAPLLGSETDAATSGADVAPSIKTGMPVSASSPHLARMASRRSSTCSMRRPSATLDPPIAGTNSPSRRSSQLAHTLNRLGGHAGDGLTPGDAAPVQPSSRRGSRIMLHGDGTVLSILREDAHTDGGTSNLQRRRSSLLAAPTASSLANRRGSDKPIPLLLGTASATEMFPRHSRTESSPASAGGIMGPYDADGLVQALAAEAAIEIAGLRDTIAQLRGQLFESEEAREASETCAKVLREFITSQPASIDGQAHRCATTPVRLPPLPTESDGALVESPNAKIKSDKQMVDKNPSTQSKKNSSGRLWGGIRMLPTLNLASTSKAFSGSNKAGGPSTPTEKLKDPLPSLAVPSLLEDRSARNGSISSESNYSLPSAPASPFLGIQQAASTFAAPNFESFSFAARRAVPSTPLLCPSPGPKSLSSRDTGRFDDSASSVGDSSESEAEPMTPTDAAFDARPVNSKRGSAGAKSDFSAEEAACITPRLV